MSRSIYIAILLLSLFSCKNEPKDSKNTPTLFPSIGAIEVINQKAKEIIDTSAKIEIIASGFKWAEGPVWVPELKGLLFSDVGANRIYHWSIEDSISVYLENTGSIGGVGLDTLEGSNGLYLEKDGSLLLCQHSNRQLLRIKAPIDSKEKNTEVLAADYKGAIFNSPNDLTKDDQGNIYFTDPPYGLAGGMEDTTRALDLQGVYKLTPDGDLSLINGDMTYPNGIAWKSSSNTLYVAQSDPKSALWIKIDLNDPTYQTIDTLHNATEYVGTAKGFPDGMKIDNRGNVFATGPGGVWIFDKDDTLVAKIRTEEFAANCAFNDDYSQLYITADDYLMRVQLK